MEEFNLQARASKSTFLNWWTQSVKSMTQQPTFGRRWRFPEGLASLHLRGAHWTKESFLSSEELMETYSRRAHGLLILRRKPQQSKTSPLEARLRWENLFTDQSPRRFTALEDMDREARTIPPLSDPKSHGMSLREVMWPYSAAPLLAKVKKLSWFSTQVCFMNENTSIQG